MTELILPRRSEHDTRGLARTIGTRPPWEAAAALRRIVVGLRGSEADPALQSVDELARRHGADLRILTVHEPRVPVPAEWQTPDTRFENADRQRAAHLLLGVRRQRRAEGAEPARCPVRLEAGDPPRVLARVAAEEGAGLIVVGIGRDRPGDRMRGSQTAVRLAHLATVPVLALAANARTLPRRALVIGACPTAEALAARVARSVLDERGELLLARTEQAGRTDRRARRIPRVSWAAEVERNGRPVRLAAASPEEVLDAADRVGADLIVTTIARTDYANRLMASGLAVPLLRLSRCSVLVVPVDPAVEYGDSMRALAAEPERGARPHPAGGG